MRRGSAGRFQERPSLNGRGETVIEGINVGSRNVHIAEDVRAKRAFVHHIDLLRIVHIAVLFVIQPAASGKVEIEFVDLLIDLQGIGILRHAAQAADHPRRAVKALAIDVDRI